MVGPKNTKYKKMHRGRLQGKASRNNKLTFGHYGLQALESIWLTPFQIEAARRVINRFIKKVGKLWIKVFPDKSITARSSESRMGSGKGTVKGWVCVIYNGTIIFELTGLSPTLAQKAFKLATYKLPIKTQFIQKATNLLV